MSKVCTNLQREFPLPCGNSGCIIRGQVPDAS